MILKFDLSNENLALLALPSDEELCYAVPFDVDENGAFIDNSYVAVTRKRIFVLQQGALKHVYKLADCQKIASEPQIDCGLFLITTKGEEWVAARFS